MIRSRSYLVEIAAQVALAAAVGLSVSIVLAGAALLLAGSAQAAGELQFKTSAGTVTAPLLATDVEIRVTGHVARAMVRQSFRNPHADWFEGIYTFPLPENAAVDQLRMRVAIEEADADPITLPVIGDARPLLLKQLESAANDGLAEGLEAVVLPPWFPADLAADVTVE